MVTVDLPEDYLVSGSVFTSDKSATSAISGLYSQMVQANLLFASNAISVFTGMSADELLNTISGPNDEFSGNSISVANQMLQNNLWSFAYKYIYQCNSLIEGLDKSTGVTPLVKNQILGEAKFIRAFCYFYLINLFGDVPLILSTDYRINAVVSRSALNEVYQQIINDLLSSSSSLTAAYPSVGRVRPNKWTAKALLARVYLYLKDYPNAENISSEIINSGTYSLVANLNSVFLSTSNETIWQLSPVQPNFNTWDGNLFISNPGIIPPYTLITSLLNIFEPADARKSSWIKPTLINGVTYYYPFKYKIKTAAIVTESQVMFRLAEQYLIRAEARLNQNNIAGAKSDLNVIRSRAGLPANTMVSIPAITEAIEKERQVELFAEWGHRWFDLKRSGKIDAILGAAKPGSWQSSDALYPIPQLEIQRNPLLTQNPGY